MEGVYVVTAETVECTFAIAVFRTLEEATAKAMEHPLEQQGWRSVFWVPWGTGILDAAELEIDRSGWAGTWTH